MSFGYQSKIVQTLAENKIVPINESIESQLLMLEKEMRGNLEEIIQRAQDLINNIDQGRADTAAWRISDSAGASGPINSVYAKVIGQATEMNSLIRFATVAVQS